MDPPTHVHSQLGFLEFVLLCQAPQSTDHTTCQHHYSSSQNVSFSGHSESTTSYTVTLGVESFARVLCVWQRHQLEGAYSGSSETHM